MARLLIVGATGLVGSEVLKLALEDKRISHVVALTRKPLSAHRKLENHIVDFDALPEHALWWHVDAAICALGTTRAETPSKILYHRIDVEYPLTVAKLAKNGGAKAFAYVSSFGASSQSFSWYLKMKGEVENKLAQIGFHSLTIVRPSFISGTRNKQRFAESLFLWVMNKIDPILPLRWRSVSAIHIAHAMIDSVLSAHAGVHIRESETLF